MNFWDALIQLGLIQGSAADLQSGNVTASDYSNVIVTAIQHTAVGSEARRFVIEMLWATGGFGGNPEWWINQPISQISQADWNNIADAAARQFSVQSQVDIPASGVHLPAGITPTNAPNYIYEPGPVTAEPGPGTTPTEPSVPTVPEPSGGGVPGGGGTPAGGETPDVPSFDYEGAAKLIAPWLPAELVGVFADAWAEYGDPQIALAAVRQDSRYDSYFPGIKRSDGSLRMSEQEYIAQIDAYSILLLEYGINPGIFSDKFVDLLSGDVSASEFAQRLESAYTQIVTSFDEVRQVYSQYYGIDMTDEAIYASFIDETVGQAILERRIAVSQVGGAAAVQGFGLDANYAARLVNAGLTTTSALNFFGRAANEIPTLQRLAIRYNAPDQSVDVTEYADFGVFQNPEQTARFRRLRAAETSAFTEQGLARADQGGSITGLTAR